MIDFIWDLYFGISLGFGSIWIWDFLFLKLSLMKSKKGWEYWDSRLPYLAQSSILSILHLISFTI